MKKKTPYPTELHNTHLIPSIQLRKKGYKPVPVEELKRNSKGQIINPFPSQPTLR